MPIVTLQRQFREIGRIRTGVQVESSTGRRRPSKLETFRLTSESESLVAAAAKEYGGSIAPWRNGDRDEFEVVTEADVLDIVVPPGQPVSQWYELWSGGGCQRRCDGVTNVLTMQPCLCPADPEEKRAGASANPPTACKPTTRLNVILSALPDIGVWRLESHGFYAAVELVGVAEILAMSTATGRLIPARLRLQQRTKKVPGKPINRYAVPIIEFVDTRIMDLEVPVLGGPMPALGDGRRVVPEIPATSLPPVSDFRGPAVVDEVHVTSDAELEDALGMSPAEAAAAIDDESGMATDVSGGDGFTQAELIGRLKEARVTLATAIAAARELWPDRPDDVPLDPGQRLALWRHVEAVLASRSL